MMGSKITPNRIVSPPKICEDKMIPDVRGTPESDMHENNCSPEISTDEQILVGSKWYSLGLEAAIRAGE